MVASARLPPRFSSPCTDDFTSLDIGEAAFSNIAGELRIYGDVSSTSR